VLPTPVLTNKPEALNIPRFYPSVTSLYLEADATSLSAKKISLRLSYVTFTFYPGNGLPASSFLSDAISFSPSKSIRVRF